MAQPRVAFLGTPSIAVMPMSALAELSHLCDIQAVFCNPDRPRGRGHLVEPPPVKAAAIKLGLDVLQPESWKDEKIWDIWTSLNIDLAIVVAYGHILPSWMLDSCKLGAWNLHFSLLPRWRGAAPVNHAILEGDTETGVSLMKIVPSLDAGPILAQCRRPITMESIAGTLLDELAHDAATLLKTHLPVILNGKTSLMEQDESMVTMAPKLSKVMARLNLDMSAVELHRQIRALQPWPGAELRIGEIIIKVMEIGNIYPTNASSGLLIWDKNVVRLSAGGGAEIELLAIQRPGKPVQPARQVMQYWGKEGSIAPETWHGCK